MKSFKLLTGLLLGCATSALAGDFIDTRVTFAFSNDNVLIRPGEIPLDSPVTGTGFGAARQNTQFFDNFNTRYTGYETLSNLTLYKKSTSFFEGFDAEAALNMLLPMGFLFNRLVTMPTSITTELAYVVYGAWPIKNSPCALSVS